MKVGTTTVFGLVIGLGAGFLATQGGMVSGASQLSTMIQRYSWPIVVACMLVPLVDYLKGMKTTFTGSLTGHPFHQLAGFFLGISAGLGLFLVLITRLI